MKNYLRNAGIGIIIFLFIITGLLYKVHTHEFLKMENLKFSQSLSETTSVKQQMNPKYNYLDQVGILIWYDNEAVDKGIVDFKILDQTGKEVYSGQTSIAEQNIGAYYYFNTNLKVNTKITYTIVISSHDATTSNPQIGLLENGDIAHFYGYMINPPYYVYVTLTVCMILLLVIYCFILKNWNYCMEKINSGEVLKLIFSKSTYLVLCIAVGIAGFLWYINSMDTYGQETGLYIIIVSLGLLTFGMLDKSSIRDIKVLIVALLIAVLKGIYLYHFRETILLSPRIPSLKYIGIIIWGTLLSVLIFKFIKKQITLNKYQIVPLLLWIIFVGCKCIFGRIETWDIPVTFCLSIFYLMPYCEKNRELLIKAVYSGIILMFLGITFFSMMFRPLDLQRFPGVFHTTTLGSEYYLAVILVLLWRLFFMIQNHNHYKSMFFVLVLWGLVWSYLLFSSARGALLAGILCSLLVGILLIIKKQKIKFIMGRCLILIGVIVIAYPLTYCIQRSIPYVVNKPYHYSFELSSNQAILKNDAIDDDKYYELSANFNLLYFRIVPANLQKIFHYTVDLADVASPGYVPQTESASNSLNDTKTDNTELTADLNHQMESITGGTGRLAIYKAFLKNVGIFGKNDIIEVGSNELNNAHNTFLQMLYSGGLFTGIIFGLMFFLQFLNTGKTILKKKTKEKELEEAVFVILILSGFALFGMSEDGIWPTHIITFCAYLTYMFWFQKNKEKNTL